MQFPVKPKFVALTIVISLFIGCATFSNYFNDNTITSAVTVATSSGLRYAVRDSAKRTVIANYIDVAASAVRTISGPATPDQLSASILAAIPAGVKSAFPEIGSFVVPIIVSNYQIAYAKFGPNVKKLYAVLLDIATGLEAGAAPYISSPKTVSP